MPSGSDNGTTAESVDAEKMALWAWASLRNQVDIVYDTDQIKDKI